MQTGFDAEDTDVDLVLDSIARCLVESASNMKRRFVCYGYRNRRKIWFDPESSKARKTLFRLLRKYERTNAHCDRTTYLECRRQYKHLLWSKKTEFNKNSTRDLEQNYRNAGHF